MGFIDKNGNYYEGDLQVGDIVIPARPSPLHIWANNAWSIPLSTAQSNQIDALTKSCAASIVAGFSSSALGTAHTYPSQPIDQSNLIGAVASGLASVTFWCADSAGVWAVTSHTAAQIKQVLADGATQRMAFSVKLKGLVDQVMTATTDAAVQAVVW